MQSNRMENSGVKVKSSRRLTQLNLFVCLKLNLYSFRGDVIPSCVTRRLTFQDVLKLEILWGIVNLLIEQTLSFKTLKLSHL